jgi:uncharacterized repeat protein (TIGR02543 family)
MMKSGANGNAIVKALFCCMLLMIAWGVQPSRAEETGWKQETASFYANFLTVDAHNGLVLRASHISSGTYRIGVHALDDGEWVPYGNYSSLGTLNAYAPKLFFHNHTPYIVYDYSRQLMVRRYENGEWVQVGESISKNAATMQIETAVDEDGTIYIAYWEKIEGKDIVQVKKLAEDGLGNVQWVDVGNPSDFEDKPGYTGSLNLVVKDRKVYLGMICLHCGRQYYEPKVFMLDDSEDGGVWTELAGNVYPLTPDTDQNYERAMFALALVQDMPHVVIKNGYTGKTLLKRYRDGEWMTIDDSINQAYFAKFAVYHGMLYMAYTETSGLYDTGDFKIWLKRWNGESWETVGKAPAIASDDQYYQTADLAVDEVTGTWYLASYVSSDGLDYRTGIISSIADDANLKMPPLLQADEPKAPGEQAVITFSDSDGAWRSAVQYVRNGSVNLSKGQDFTWSGESLILHPNAMRAGANRIIVTAAGYADAGVTQLVRPHPPEGLRVDRSGYGFIDVSWDPPAEGDPYAEADSYVITYDPGDAQLAESVAISGTAVTSYRLKGLDPEAVYSISIQSVKDDVLSLPSGTVNAEPKLVPDGIGKSWERVGSMVYGDYPDIETNGDELWVAVTPGSYEGLSVYRYVHGGDWTLVGPPRFVDAGLMADLEFDGNKAYIALSDRENDGKVTVMRWSGTQWEPIGERGFSEGFVSSALSMAVYDGIPYVAYAEVDMDDRLRVKGYAEDAGDGTPGWVDMWQTEVTDLTAVQLRQHEGKLYLAYADYSYTQGYAVHLYSLDLHEAQPEWREVPADSGLQPRAWFDLGLDVDTGGNLYVSFDREVWKYTPGGEDGGTWESLGSPSERLSYAKVTVIDGQPFVAFTYEGRAHVYKHVNGQWYRVGDTVIGYSGSAGSSRLAEKDGLPILAFHNGNDQVEFHQFVYDLAAVTVIPNDGNDPYVLNVRVGEPMAELAPLERDHYTFLGWFDENGDEFDFASTVVSGPMTLQAFWKLVTPAGLKAEEGDRMVSLEWTPIEEAVKYVVYYSEQADLSDAVELETVDASIQIKDLTYGKTYYFAVRAFDEKFGSDRSDIVSATPFTVPSAPRNVRVTEGDRQISIEFDAPEDDGGREIVQYHVYLDGENKWSGSALSTTITGLVNRHTYEVVVTAENEAGESDPSPPVMAMPYAVCTIYWMMRDDTSYSMEEMLCGDLIEEPVPQPRPGYRFEGWYDGLTGEPFDFSVPVENGFAMIEGRWSLVPQELPYNEWNVLNDLSVPWNPLEMDAADGKLITASIEMDMTTYSNSLVVSQFDRDNGWSEIGRFANAIVVGKIAFDDHGDIIIPYVYLDDKTYLRVMRYSPASPSWSELLHAEFNLESDIQISVDHGDVFAKYVKYGMNLTMSLFILKYSSAEGVTDLSSGVIGEEGIFIGSSNTAMLRHAGDLYFAYADKDRLIHVKRLDGTGWTELGTLASFGKTDTVPQLQLHGYKDGLLLLYMDASMNWKMAVWDGDSWSLWDDVFPVGATKAAVFADDDEGVYVLFSRKDEHSTEEQLVLNEYKNGAWRQVGSPVKPGGNLAWNLKVVADHHIPFIGYSNGNIFSELVIRGYYRPICTVTVDRLDGGEPTILSVPCGDPVAEPTVQAKPGYTLTGWYTSSAAEQPWNFADPVVEDMTLIPKWKWNYTGALLPIDLKVTAGDGTAQLEWKRLEHVYRYDVFLRKAEEMYGELPYETVTVTEAVYETVTNSVYYTLTGLENFTIYYVKIAIENEEGETAESPEQSFMPVADVGDPQEPKEPQEPGDPQEPGEPQKPEEPQEPEEPQKPEEPEEPEEPQEPEEPGESEEPEESGETRRHIDIWVNGKPQPIGTAMVGEENGRSLIVVQVDDQRMAERLQDEEDGITVVIAVMDEADMVRGKLTGRVVKQLNEKQATVEIQTEQARYVVPAQALIIDALSDVFSGVPFDELEFEMEIAKPTEAERQAVDEAVANAGGSVIGAPIAFKVTVHHGGQTAELTDFNMYLERWFELQDGDEDITTAVVVEPDGSLRHVPTRIITVDGRRYAVVNSLTNSVYTLIFHQAHFTDIDGHWAEDVISDMGNRLIVRGKGSGRFAPDMEVTRAEFAAMLVRALGLKPVEDAEFPFSDAAEAGSLASALATAHHYGLMHGYEDGTSRPNQSITREQAFTMVVRAIRLIDPGFTHPSPMEPLPFIDADDMSSWAVSSVTAAYETGMIHGNSRNELNPQAKITRAETAAIIHRLLRTFNLIN